MDRREFLATVTAAVGVAVAPAGVPCDIMISNEGDCPRAAAFEYADPGANRAPRPIGPRNFCKEHVGCATLPLIPIVNT
jgi:hypothetical protein